MVQELRQTLKLTQQLVMTPQLQQAIKLLQLTRMELVEATQHELDENPFLEEIEEREEAEKVKEQLPESIADDAGPTQGANEMDILPTTSSVKEFDWSSYIEQQSVYGYQGGYQDEEKADYETPMTHSGTLAEHLEWQLQMSDLPDPLRTIAAYLIRELDENGYLKRALSEIAAKLSMLEDDVEEALLAIQEFDPPGVGARDLRECLLVQLRQLGNGDVRVKKVVSDHLHDLEKRNYKVIAQALKTSIPEVGQIVKAICQLEPKPGRPFGVGLPLHITPDIYVVKIVDEYVVVLNDDGMPKLRISNYYKKLLVKKDNAASKKEKEYVQERLRSAVWLIRSIHQRQRTIYKVTQSIVKFQREFFEKGVKALAPLILRDVAEDINMHESTISRATTNKYVHTPQGIYELKYFFNSGIDSKWGEQVASEAVKKHISEIIAGENTKKPYSDQEIVRILERENGLIIARRTVTKYREMMGVLSSTKRKSPF